MFDITSFKNKFAEIQEKYLAKPQVDPGLKQELLKRGETGQGIAKRFEPTGAKMAPVSKVRVMQPRPSGTAAVVQPQQSGTAQVVQPPQSGTAQVRPNIQRAAPQPQPVQAASVPTEPVKPVKDEEIEEYIKTIKVSPKENPNSVPYKYNNIGSLEFHGQPNAKADSGTGRFAEFPDAKTGYRALLKQIQLDQTRDYTLRNYILKYAPEHENDVGNYIGVLMDKTGATVDTPIKDIDIFELAKAIAWMEGNTEVIDNI